jgi:endonuclease YncB( thermonuclease family)
MRDHIFLSLIVSLLAYPIICIAEFHYIDSCKVIAISDGDTITILHGTTQTTIRLHGIDCPEGGQAFGKKAKQFTSALCFGKTVRIKPTDKDHYDRTVAIVYLEDGRELNREILAAGMGWHYVKYSSDASYAAAEMQARNERKGLWSDVKAIPPGEYRARQRGATPALSGAYPSASAGPYHGRAAQYCIDRACRVLYGWSFPFLSMLLERQNSQN